MDKLSARPFNVATVVIADRKASWSRYRTSNSGVWGKGNILRI